MCRFLAYRGRPVLMDELLYQPKNSLIRQSVKARESEEPLNGDGFGVGWYAQELDPTPGVFVSVRPAWNDHNLRYISKKILSNCIFAHVRAASISEVSEANCHPFHYKNFLFMHNGDIEGFEYIKRYLRRKLSDETYDWIRGQTDSEHMCALFIENLKKKSSDPDAFMMAEALEETMAEIEEIKREKGVKGDSYANIAITDGRHVIAMRYVSDDNKKAPTLYYSEGGRYICHDGICQMSPADPMDHSILIVSEKLTASHKDWKVIPQNTMLIVDQDLKISERPVRLRA
jgi:glutamine amidotransferase